MTEPEKVSWVDICAPVILMLGALSVRRLAPAIDQAAYLVAAPVYRH